MKKFLTVLTLFLVFCVLEAMDTNNTFQEDYSEFNENVYKKFIMMDNQMKSMAEKSVKDLLPTLLKAREHTNISANCTRNVISLLTGIRKLKSWSFTFLDSIGKIQSGMQAGNLHMFGEYEECLDIVVTKREKVDFQGQYCLIQSKPYLPKLKKIPCTKCVLEGLVNATKNASDIMKLMVARAHLFYATYIKVGICVPSGCSKEDISEIVNYTVGEYMNATVKYCLKKGDVDHLMKSIPFIIFGFSVLGVLAIVGTLFDNKIQSLKNTDFEYIARIFQCFSLTRNFPKLMDINISEKSVTCFYGIRVLTVFWIILENDIVVYALYNNTNHIINFEKMQNNFFSQIVLNGFFSSDILFFTSGFFNSYSRIQTKKEGKDQPNVLKIFFHRVWRIYPSFVAAFFLMMILNVPRAHLYAEQTEQYENCKQRWWQSFMFFGNYVEPGKMCMPHAWYICAEMQLFVVSLLTIPILLRSPKIGIILHIFIILATNISSMSWWLFDDVSPAVIDSTNLELGRMTKRTHIYTLPVVHLGSYFIGIIFGYIAVVKKDVKIPKINQLLGWLVASLFFTSMLFITLRWNSGTPYTQLESAFYGAWSRTVVVVSFSWLVFCCFTGNAGLINYILSLKVWIPLSRVVYVIYLLSPIIQTHYRCHQTFPMDFSNINIIWNYFATLSISILMSFAVALLVDCPCLAMEKMFFQKKEFKSEFSFDTSNEVALNNTKETDYPKLENLKE